MANFARGLAIGSEVGAKFGESYAKGLDLAEKRKKNERAAKYAEIASAKPQENTTYTPVSAADQIAQEQGISMTPDAQARLSQSPDAQFGLGVSDPSRRMSSAPGTTQGVQASGLSNQAAPRAPTETSASTGFSYLGENFASKPSPDEMKAVQYAKMADVISADDPEKGLLYRAQADQLMQRGKDQKVKEYQLSYNNDIAGLIRTDGHLDPTKLAAIQEKYRGLGIDLTSANKLLLDHYNVSDKQASHDNLVLKDNIGKALMKGIPAVNVVIGDALDPDATDSLKPKLRSDANGVMQLYYGDKPMTEYGKFRSMNEFGSAVNAFIDHNPLAHTANMLNLDLAKQKIIASKAQATLHLAQAGAAGKLTAAQTQVHNDKISSAVTKQVQKWVSDNPGDPSDPEWRGNYDRAVNGITTRVNSAYNNTPTQQGGGLAGRQGQGAPRTATTAEVEATAKARGMTADEVIKTLGLTVSDAPATPSGASSDAGLGVRKDPIAAALTQLSGMKDYKKGLEYIAGLQVPELIKGKLYQEFNKRFPR